MSDKQPKFTVGKYLSSGEKLSIRLGQDGPMWIDNFLQIDGGRRDRGLGRRLRRRVRAGAVLCQPCHAFIQWENHRSDALRFRDRWLKVGDLH